MKIIFKNKDNTIGILIPTQQAIDLFGIDLIAQKDVPKDLPYWIVEDTEIPKDRTDRNAWYFETDKEPDGYGSQFHTFKELV